MTSGSCCVADYYFVIARIMRKIVMLLIVFLSFGFVWGQYADTNPLANTPGYTEEQQSDIDNQFIDNIDIPDTSSQEEDVADLV